MHGSNLNLPAHFEELVQLAEISTTRSSGTTTRDDDNNNKNDNDLYLVTSLSKRKYYRSYVRSWGWDITVSRTCFIFLIPFEGFTGVRQKVKSWPSYCTYWDTNYSYLKVSEQQKLITTIIFF